MTEINEGASKIRYISPFVVVCLLQLILNHYILCNQIACFSWMMYQSLVNCYAGRQVLSLAVDLDKL